MTVVIDGTAGITFPDTSVQATAKMPQPASMVRVNTDNGYGSTNTKIPRFSTVAQNQGSDITGVYSMAHTRVPSGGSDMGISLNTSEPTVNVASLVNTNDRIALASSTTTNYAATSQTTMYLPAGSVVRPHTDGAGAGTAARCQFTITRVA
jgi:hypothetical protein